MRSMLLVVAACTGSRSPTEQPSAPDAAAADASTIDSSAEWFARIPSDVAIGSTTIAWSELEAPCGLETGAGCHGPGPVITIANAQGDVSTLVTGLYGASSITGDESGWFYIDRSTAAVMRVVEGESPVMLSASAVSGYPVGPALDATYVYWWQPGVNGAGHGIWRASRGGNGSDATLVAQPDTFQDSLYAFAGDLWWSVCSTSCAVYRASSQSPVHTGAMIVGADANALYLVEIGPTWNLLSMASDAATTMLLSSQPQSTEPQPGHFVADGGELFWATGGSIYRAVANGASTRIATTDDVTDDVFAVTATEILHSFTPHGYTAQPR